MTLKSKKSNFTPDTKFPHRKLNEAEHPPYFIPFRDRITWTQFNFRFNIGIHHQYIYIGVPKCASSTIRHRLLAQERIIDLDDLIKKADGKNDCDPGVQITHQAIIIDNSYFKKPYQYLYSHEIFRHPYQFDDEYFVNSILGKYPTFTFVREPVERLLSAYLYVIRQCHNTPYPQGKHDPYPYKQFLKDHMPERKDSKKEITFQEFIDSISQSFVPHIKLDPHWRPQSELILSGQMSYDFVGCVGRFEDDWSRLREIMQFPFSDDGILFKNIGAKKWTGGAKEQIDDLVSPKLRKQIENLYHEDVELYQNVLKHGHECLKV